VNQRGMLLFLDVFVVYDDEGHDDDVDESYVYDDVSSNATTIFL
jgi:uncharacterized protein Veg